jgi:hypothetical protein
MRNNIPVPVVIGTVAGWGFIVTVTSGRFHLIRGVDFEKLVERRSRDKGWAVHCTLLPRATVEKETLVFKDGVQLLSIGRVPLVFVAKLGCSVVDLHAMSHRDRQVRHLDQAEGRSAQLHVSHHRQLA